MSAELSQIINWVNKWLETDRIKDYCPNGLQVQGKSDVSKILLGVTACQALIDQAIAKNADMVLVHHGYFWKGETQVVTGQKRNRLKALLSHDISLAAYHLPLDIHPEVGNNAMLARNLGLEVSGYHTVDGLPLIAVTKLPQPMMLAQWLQHVAEKLGRQPQLIRCPAAKPLISTVALCTGAAQNFISEAESLGVDLFLSGEISEPTYHAVMEGSVHYVAAGHHATERYGVQALARKIAAHFDVDVEFVDIDNPV